LSGLCRLCLTRLRARSRRGPKKCLATLLGAASLPSSAVDIEATGNKAADVGTESDVAAWSDRVATLPNALLPSSSVVAFDSETGVLEWLVPPTLLHRLPQSRRSLSVRVLSCPSNTVMSPSAASTHIPFSRSSDVGLERSNASSTASASSGDSASRTCWIASWRPHSSTSKVAASSSSAFSETWALSLHVLHNTSFEV